MDTQISTFTHKHIHTHTTWHIKIENKYSKIHIQKERKISLIKFTQIRENAEDLHLQKRTHNDRPKNASTHMHILHTYTLLYQLFVPLKRVSHKKVLRGAIALSELTTIRDWDVRMNQLGSYFARKLLKKLQRE